MVTSPSSSLSSDRLPSAPPADSPPADPPSPSVQRQNPTIPTQRWHIPPARPEQAIAIAHATDLSPLLAQVLINRAITTPDLAQLFLNPDGVDLPSPLEDFPDLAIAVQYLVAAIAQGEKIAICGDYDADGMTSTALLIRALRELGAIVNYAIPSRMTEGYGINERIVEEFHAEGIRIILTVDNGIAAIAPITRAVELGLVVIVTDHHDLPDTLPPAQAILNPKLIAETSPYRGLAGVGVAYILALELARTCWAESSTLAVAQTALGHTLLDLFTLGTIADLAPLTGVNRRWVQQGLRHLPKSTIPGVQALIQVAGLSDEKKGLKPEAIGCRLGPRINAVGRIADPVTVIELLTTDDSGIALEQAMVCEQINQERRRLCEVIEQEAIAHIRQTQPNLQAERVLVVIHPGWHHGVIGIVASRLVERYGVPVFIGTYEDDSDRSMIRGSARSIPEFDIHKSLVFCDDCLEKYGGHRAAGGFTLAATHLTSFQRRLQLFANMYLLMGHLYPLVNVDVEANFTDLTLDLYHQIDRLHPCGIGNPDPIFWTPNVQVIEQKTVGKNRDHLKLVLQQNQSEPDSEERTEDRTLRIEAIAWRWGHYCPLPSIIDLAYRLTVNEWQGQTTLQLDVVGIRLPQATVAVTDRKSAAHEGAIATPTGVLTQSVKPIRFQHGQRFYDCSIDGVDDHLELRIRNDDGRVLAIQPQAHRAIMGHNRTDAQEIDITQPHYFHLIKAALNAMEVYQSTRQL
ncbi:MAG: single-stranded-DNA-specific exonuclease RecJ [Leptolyngbyaceae bacterium]|nr:single-stranded-DNA-specific exonuclease RecJ [Leptolyngbyaceae bacterium]